MTKNKFYHTQIGAGMTATHKIDGIRYKIKGVDWIKDRLLLDTDSGGRWVGINRIESINEPLNIKSKGSKFPVTEDVKGLSK